MWFTLLDKENDFSAASVSTFKHCPLAEVWSNFVNIGLKVEVKNKDVAISRQSNVNTKGPKVKQDYYWIASVVSVAGYFVRLRFEGFDSDDSYDFWLNISSNQIHPVGWCAAQGKVLIPPRAIAEKCSDWKAVLVKRLTGSRTLPVNFAEQLKECLNSRFKPGMRLECVDKRRISAVRIATIDKIVGCRLHLTYEGDDDDYDPSFWCHQDSPLIHPVGWARIVGHELKSTQEYATTSLEKTMEKNFDENDAKWYMFTVPKYTRPSNTTLEQEFREGMKLEAIDPLNLSTICPATVTKVLRNNYLMVGIDGVMADDGSDWFCYHASSPSIFPVGFSQLNNIPLTPPKGYHREFDWFTYLKETRSIAAPVNLFKRELPNHGLKEGMFLEAVDLMVPRLVCVATITKVVGRLLRIHFNGWDESYDQWCDCESSELYPIGWCQMVGYPLEPPKDPDGNDTNNTSFGLLDGRQKKRNSYKGRYRKRKRGALSITNGVSHLLSNSSFSIFDKASTSDHADTSISSVSSLNCDWASPDPSASPNTSNHHTVGMSNSSVVIKPSPVEPLYKDRKLSDDLRHWTVEDVCQFLYSNDCGSYCQYFMNKVCNSLKTT